MDKILIDRKDLEKLLEDAHKWRAMEQCTELMGELKPEEWDAAILEYCEDTGIAFPSDFSGRDALDILIFYDIDFYEKEGEMIYDKREND